jgi:hypothetical protein
MNTTMVQSSYRLRYNRATDYGTIELPTTVQSSYQLRYNRATNYGTIELIQERCASLFF